MDWFTLFITKLARPLVLFANGVFALFLKIDEWWSKKRAQAKAGIRYFVFILFLITLQIFREINLNNQQVIRENKAIIEYNILVKEKKELENWKINRLMSENEELKEIQGFVSDNKEKIKLLTNETETE